MNLDSLRDELRRRERDSLASYATRSTDTQGRVYPEPEHPLRSPFQRDRDRVIHSTAFRRLEYKTQVFVNHEGDYYRTRLTHSIEAGQITRTLCRVLGLNEDVGEAVALSHDLGHTPFGHAGERVLNRLMEPYGGFEHNAQSLRIVDVLEERYPGFPGLNLSWEVREGIVKHSSEYDRPLVQQFAPGVQPVLEAQIVDFADEIAYNSHDIDDGLKSEMLEERDLATVALWAEAREEVRREHGGASESVQRYQTVRRIIDRLVTDMIVAILGRVEEYGVQTLADVRACPVRLAGLSPAMAECNIALKRVLLDRLYRHHRVTRMTMKAQRVMTELFHTYMDEPLQMPPHVTRRIDVDDPKPRVVADYIAGMTDRFAFDEYRKLFDPYERVLKALMKKVLDLLIHLEDHKHDGLGRLFLDPSDEREVKRSLRDYLGAKVTVKTAVVEGQRLRVRVELPDFQAESDNLVRLARDMAARARPSSALGQLEEAIKIFPLNGPALKGLGRACYGRGDLTGAAAFFVRANEVLREDGEALKALGTISLREGREPSALAYFERAAVANPKDEAATGAVEQLRERMASKFRGGEAKPPVSDDRTPPPRRPR